MSATAIGSPDRETVLPAAVCSPALPCSARDLGCRLLCGWRSLADLGGSNRSLRSQVSTAPRLLAARPQGLLDPESTRTREPAHLHDPIGVTASLLVGCRRALARRRRALLHRRRALSAHSCSCVSCQVQFSNAILDCDWPYVCFL